MTLKEILHEYWRRKLWRFLNVLSIMENRDRKSHIQSNYTYPWTWCWSLIDRLGYIRMKGIFFTEIFSALIENTMKSLYTTQSYNHITLKWNRKKLSIVKVEEAYQQTCLENYQLLLKFPNSSCEVNECQFIILRWEE